MSAFDKLSTKENYTDLESAIITFAFHERRARGDGEHPAAAKAATELVQLQDEHKFMSEQIDKLNAPMPCGHLARYAVNEEDGTQYCCMCLCASVTGTDDPKIQAKIAEIINHE